MSVCCKCNVEIMDDENCYVVQFGTLDGEEYISSMEAEATYCTNCGPMKPE